MTYLISEIRLYLIIGVGLGILLGWIFHRSDQRTELEQSNMELGNTIDRLKGKLRSCEESAHTGAE